MKTRVELYGNLLCLGWALLGTGFLAAAEPAWLCPSYQITEVTRLHYALPRQDPPSEMRPSLIGLGANSQVAYSTEPSFLAPFGRRLRLWQPEAQFGHGPGSSILEEGGYSFFNVTQGTGVTSDGRFASIIAGTASYGGLTSQLRWWDGFQWVTRLDEGVVAGQLRSPYAIAEINDRGDIAFNYTLYQNLGGTTPAKVLSRAGIWSGGLNSWLPVFPEASTRAFVLSMNGKGVSCGVYRAADAPPGTPHRGFTASYGTVPVDFAPVGTIGGYSQTHGINDAGEVVGVTGTQAGGVRPFIFLPSAAHGLSPGLHEIGPTMAGYTGTSGDPLPISSRITINNRGQALLTPGTYTTATPHTNGFLWQRGQRWPLAQLADVSGYRGRYAGDSPWYADLRADPETGGNMMLHQPYGFNDRGEILLLGITGFVSNSDYESAVLLLRPKLISSLALENERTAPGATNRVRLRLQNAFTSALGSPGTPVLHWAGPETPEILSGPTRLGPNTWSPGMTNEWIWTVRFTNATSGLFVAQGSAAGVNSTLAESPVLKVVVQGDLWLRRTQEPVSAFIGNDVYAGNPNGQQLKVVTSAKGDTNSFDVRIQNDASAPAAFVLRSAAPDAAKWRVVYRQGATDISSRVLSPAGWQTPELPTQGYTDVTLSVQAVTAEEGDQLSVTTFLTSLKDAERIDEVVAVTSIAAVPVETEMRRVTAPGYTPTSLAAGMANADAPLDLVTSGTVLGQQPLIHGGWVADGVTPMLLQMTSTARALEPFTKGRQFRLELTIDRGGAIAGAKLTDRIRLLHKGSWAGGNEFELTSAEPATFAMLTPVAADELLLSGDNELTLGVKVVDVLSGELASQITLRLRKPPIVLIHGYNTEGDWDDAFVLELSRSRPLPTDDFRWVRVAKYGIDQTAGAYVSQMINTLYPLDELVPRAEQAYEEAVAPLREQWAFTRFDAVCHSQGGLLTRMLCSEKTSLTLSRPFRNELNHYRGRFHRVVTLGSPHNGTRLLRYLLALNETKLGLLKNNLPKLIGYVGVFSEVAQAKFDPFGVQIRDLNNPSPGSRWKPDPAAKFHLVRTTINRGFPPFAEDLCPSYSALGLFHPVAGPAVLPRGSDGVVDFDSMGAQGPNQPAAANVFTLNRELLVSHSPPLDVFGAGVGQTASPDVGAHVIAALDQDPSIPPSERLFSSFVLPPLLEDSIRQEIDHWSDVSVFEFAASAIQADGAAPQLQGAGEASATQLRFVLVPPPQLPVTRHVSWSAEAFTASGIGSESIGVEVDPADSRKVTMKIPSGLVGDVVIYASYVTTNGAVVLAAPQRIFSSEPQGATLVGIEIEPGKAQLPVGSRFPIKLLANYSDGSVVQRHVQAGELTATSLAPNVVDTTNPLVWHLVGVGEAGIAVSYRGISTTNRLTSFTPVPLEAPALIAERQGESILLRWVAIDTRYVLESTLNTPPTNGWQPDPNPQFVVGGERLVTNSIAGSRRYYRLRRD